METRSEDDDGQNNSDDLPDGDRPVQPGQEFDPIQVDHRKQNDKTAMHPQMS